MNRSSTTERGNDSTLVDYRDVLAPTFVAYLAYESTALGLRSYQSHVVHGLLQTKEYAQSLGRRVSKPDTPQQARARQVEARLARRGILDRGSGPLHFILDESVLLRPTEPGETGMEILRGQLRRLVELDQHPRVTIQVLPFRTGMHAGTSGSFTILEPQQPNLYRYLVYRERDGGSSITTEPHDVATYQHWFEALASASISLHDHHADVPS